MINFYPFLFRFGISFDVNISKEILDALTNFFSLRYKSELVLPGEADNYQCLSISDKDATDFTPVLSYRFEEKLKEYNIVDFQSSILFIDIRRAYSDKFIDGFLLPELQRLISSNSLKPQNHPLFILYIDALEEGSLVYDKLFAMNVNHRFMDYCMVYDKRGNFTDNTLQIKNDKDLIKLISESSTSALDKFQFKLVRKINHFKINNELTHTWAACQQYFYEGVKCQDEVFELLYEALFHTEYNPHYIVHDTIYSTWLNKAVDTIANTISSETFTQFSNYHSTKGNKCIDIVDILKLTYPINPRNCTILFITDLIHSGKRFKKVIKRIANRFPNAQIHCISALVTNSAFKSYKNGFSETERKIGIGKQEIKYFKKVDQIFYDKGPSGTLCPMCNHKLLPEVETSNQISSKLNSYEMWHMSEEAGYKIEDYPRPSRIDQRIIPDSIKIFKRNGALLAIKFEQQLIQTGIYPANEVVIVYPNETQVSDSDSEIVSQSEKTASGYFAKCLNLYNPNLTYLAIPRSLIRAFENNSDINFIRETYPKIIKQLEEIERPIVIMDEANFSGETFRSLAVVLQQLDLNVVSYFPIFNYDPYNTEKKYDDPRFADIKFLSLYDLSLAND